MRKGGVSFWAWMISITVHLVALTAFGIARFSHSPVQAEHYITHTSIAKAEDEESGRR